jgi:hypothetical protein
MMRCLRWFWFAVVCLALFVAAGTHAQDPRASEAQAAARSWLLIADKGDVEASWSAAGKKFREVLDLTTWRQALSEARRPLGAVRTRTMRATRFDTKMPGGPDGDYAQVLFETDFAQNSSALETVTLEREPDGAWRVMGYLIR